MYDIYLEAQVGDVYFIDILMLPCLVHVRDLPVNLHLLLQRQLYKIIIEIRQWLSWHSVLTVLVIFFRHDLKGQINLTPDQGP